jgi:hypothetical protein
MGAQDLLENLTRSGFSVSTDGANLVIRPASKLSAEMRAALAASKPELLEVLAATAAEVWAELAGVIHQVCDARGDDPGNRDALLIECSQQTQGMQRDLIEHFREVLRMYQSLGLGGTQC